MQKLYRITKKHEDEIIGALEDYEIDECYKNDFTTRLQQEITGRNYEVGMDSVQIEGFIAGYISCMKWHDLKPKTE